MRRDPHPQLPNRLPLFPLAGALLLPRAVLPLQIFEPRYLQMLEDALKSGHRLIGMIQPAGDGLAQVGSAGRIAAFTETGDGRMLIQLRAVSRFRLGGVEQGFLPYVTGTPDWSDFSRDLNGPEQDPDFRRGLFLGRVRRFMQVRDLTTDWDAMENSGVETLINALSMLLPFAPEEKQALLEAKTLAERRELLDGLVKFALHGGETEERLQ